MVRLPLLQLAPPQKILVIEAQLLQARPGHVGQFELGFLGSCRRLAPLGDVLHSAPGRLHHLIAGSAALVEVTVAKPDRHVIDKLRKREALQIAITAAEDLNPRARPVNNHRVEKRTIPLISIDLKRTEMLLSRYGIASSQDILVGVQEPGLFQSVD